MTRIEHLKWCKNRALAEVDSGNLSGAIASMISDVGKHNETNGIVLAPLMMIGMAEAQSGNTEGVRRWITGFA